MSASYMNALLAALKFGKMTETANGAVTYGTSLSYVLDFYSLGAACRLGERSALPLFIEAFQEDSILAISALFYARDIRQGQGERALFRECLAFLEEEHSDYFNRIVHLVPTYGRWDDILTFWRSPNVVALVRQQLIEDVEGEGQSLLGKWMPSENASSKQTRALARCWMQQLGMKPRQYRKMLTELRRRIHVVESDMSAKNFKEINYEHVPSLAMKRYRKAFKAQDEERFSAYLGMVARGEKKIHSSTLYPYDIVKSLLRGPDQVLELQWKALPDYIASGENILVMADVSPSMIGNPIAASIALALYTAERSKGAFRNHFLTFAAKPTLVELKGDSLYERMGNIRVHAGLSTDIVAAFEEILQFGVRFRVPQTDMPTKVFIISDMEFNWARGGKTNFEEIEELYISAGYERPQLVFWNVASGSTHVPVTSHESGTALVSGLSPVIFERVLQSRTLSPMLNMLDVLNSERYQAVQEALRGGVDLSGFFRKRMPNAYKLSV